MPERVPAEFVGRARDLRRRLAATEVILEPAMHRALAPLQRRLQRHPIIRKETLIDAIRAWHALPAFGRIRSSIDTSNRRAPLFDDLRVCPGRYRDIGWAEGDFEDAVAVVLISASVVGRDMVIAAHPIVTASLHAIARKFERGRSAEAALLAELGELALCNFAAIADAGGDFSHAVAGGHWLGHVVEGKKGEVVVSLRTFLAADAPQRLAA
jgi:hypothetical protein